MYRNYHEGVRYSLQPGDSFWGLAHQFDLTAEELYAANPVVNPYYLVVGQEIFIPTLNRQKDCITPREVELMRNERSLWEEHVAWTRMAIISLTFNLPDIEFVLARLFKNASDMGDNFRQNNCYIVSYTY